MLSLKFNFEWKPSFIFRQTSKFKTRPYQKTGYYFTKQGTFHIQL